MRVEETRTNASNRNSSGRDDYIIFRVEYFSRLVCNSDDNYIRVDHLPAEYHCERLFSRRTISQLHACINESTDV